MLHIDKLPIEPGEKIEHRTASQVGIDSHLAGQVSDARPRLKPFCLAIVPEDESSAAVGPQQVKQYADGGGLAGPVQSEKAEYFPLNHIKGQIAQGRKAPVAFRNSLD